MEWRAGAFWICTGFKNSTLIVNPEEAEIVRIIFDQFTRTEAGADSICKYLNQHGYYKEAAPGSGGQLLFQKHDLKILDNPVSCREDCLREK